MIRLFLCLLLLAPVTAVAQSFPALHDVTGVASDDTLNIRSGPGASHDIIGEFAHDATDIEVVALAEGGTWGLVNVSEQSGWASMAFLARQPGDWTDTPTPIAGCFGTEPFWSLTGLNGTVTFTNLGEELLSAPVSGPVGSTFLGQLALSASGESGFLTLVVEGGMCGDGMSDRAYGLTARVVSTLDGMGTELWSGCCTLSP